MWIPFGLELPIPVRNPNHHSIVYPLFSYNTRVNQDLVTKTPSRHRETSLDHEGFKITHNWFLGMRLKSFIFIQNLF
jgi:hypothetical protein